MLNIDSNLTRGAWQSTFLMTHCGRTRRPPRRVPAVSLEHVVSKWLRGRDVSFVKVDAQGYDLAVAQSAASAARRIQVMKLEVTADECRTAYVGAPTCSSTVAGMRELGFVELTSCADVKWRNRNCAADLLFTRSKRRAR